MIAYRLTAPPLRARRCLHTVVVLAISLALILFAARAIASFVIEYRWWQEMNQVPAGLGSGLYLVILSATAVNFDQTRWEGRRKMGKCVS